MKKLTKKKKEEIVERIIEEIKQNKCNFIIGFSGLTVQEIQQIREELKGEGCKMEVVKNTLLQRIYQRINQEDICRHIEGPTFIIEANPEDEISIVKKIYNFQKEIGKIDVKAALIGNKLYTSKELSIIEKLPRRKEIEAKIVWNLKMPMIRIINALNFPILRVINDLKQISENKRKEKENGKD